MNMSSYLLFSHIITQCQSVLCMSTVSSPEGFLSVVAPQVSLEVVLEPEAEATGLTHEGLLSRVNHSVLQQTHPALEGLVALGAFERPLLRV